MGRGLEAVSSHHVGIELQLDNRELSVMKPNLHHGAPISRLMATAGIQTLRYSKESIPEKTGNLLRCTNDLPF